MDEDLKKTKQFKELKSLKSLKSQFKIMSAEEARKKLENKIYSDPNFIFFSENLLKELENAIIAGNNKVVFKKNTNDVFNTVVKNTLINKGYNVSEDIVVKYKKNNEYNEYDDETQNYTEIKVFVIEF